MKFQITYFSVLLITYCVFLSSCYSPRYVYSPASSNVPLLAKKGDSKLSGYYAINPGEKSAVTSVGKLNSGYGIDVQGAYAITNHLAIQGSYSKRWEKNYADFNLNSSDSSVINYNRNIAEFGLGFYTCIDERRNSFFQLFGGAGFGKSSFTDKFFTGNIPARNFNMDVTKLYLQPSILIRNGEVFASSFSSRVSILYFRNVKYDYTVEEGERYQLKDIGKGTKIFWEPAFVNAFGLKKIPGLKIEIQMAMSFLMTQKFVDYRTYNLSAGMLLDIPKLFKKKEDEKN